MAPRRSIISNYSNNNEGLICRKICFYIEESRYDKLADIINKTNVNFQYQGWTPLLWATRVSKDPICVRMLLEAGADAGIVNSAGKSAMHFAAANNNVKVMKEMEHSPTVIDHPCNVGMTPLMTAAGYNSVEALKKLLSWGADCYMKNDAGMTALAIAEHHHCWFAYVELKNFKNTSYVSAEELTALHEMEDEAERLCHCIISNRTELIQSVLTTNNCNTKWNGRSLLMLAASQPNNQSLETVKLLMELGAVPDIADCSGWTAAHLAAEAGNEQVLRVLAPAAAFSSTELCISPLMVAVGHNKLEAVAALLDMGADMHAKDFNGNCAVSIADTVGTEEMRILLNEFYAKSRMDNAVKGRIAMEIAQYLDGQETA